WGRPDSALFLFTKKIVEDEPIDVYNNGHMYRDFTYVDDIVQGVVAAIDKSYAYEIINLARGETVKLTDYISEIEKNLGKRATKHMMPLQPGDPINSFADISKAKKLLNFQPKTSVKKGIKKFIDWYLEYYQVDM
ncbi:MAG: GDP-mannose 4,6-dehydratase, partial [Candidatus Komeilibacteria bacterium]